MLFLRSDVGPEDAPNAVASGSHLEAARLLGSAGRPGDFFADCRTTDATDRPPSADGGHGCARGRVAVPPLLGYTRHSATPGSG